MKLSEVNLESRKEVYDFCKFLASKEGYEVVEYEYEQENFYIYTTELECCMEDLEQGISYDFCLQDSEGNIWEFYCGSKCYLQQYNFKNRFNKDWTMITVEQFGKIKR